MKTRGMTHILYGMVWHDVLCMSTEFEKELTLAMAKHSIFHRNVCKVTYKKQEQSQMDAIHYLQVGDVDISL